MKISQYCLETLNGEDFIIWKKELCILEISDSDGNIIRTECKRLEFHWELLEEDLILDWLEPEIYDDKAILVLHCSIDELPIISHERN